MFVVVGFVLFLGGGGAGGWGRETLNIGLCWLAFDCNNGCETRCCLFIDDSELTGLLWILNKHNPSLSLSLSL